MNRLTQPTIAAVVRRDNGGIDDLVAGFAISLINRGWWVRGLVQETHQGREGCKLSLVSLDDGKLYPISHHFGKHVSSCRLDPAGITEASKVLHQIADEGADLAVFNRFSGLEVQGDGFCNEMLNIMSQAIPSLCIVPERHLAAWQYFTGGLAVELVADRQSLENWFFGSQPPAADALAARIGQAAHPLSQARQTS